jgi:hypothetical protein
MKFREYIYNVSYKAMVLVRSACVATLALGSQPR